MPAEAADRLLEARQIIRRARTGAMLLASVDLAIDAGMRVAIVGGSGSGKTVLLRSLALLDPLDAGEVRWHDGVIADRDVPRFRRHVMYLHQRPPLVEGTVEDNLRRPYQLRAHRGSSFQRKRAVTWLATLDRPASFLEKRQRDLSGGEAQLVALLRSIQMDPEILLLDEPTAALDAAATDTVEQLVDRWVHEDRRRAAIWVTHDAAQARRVADRLFSMNDGELFRFESAS